VSYTNNLPESLRGYSAAFLSYGNAVGGTFLDNHMAGIIIDYLENGGYVYMEGSSNMGWCQLNNYKLYELFGLVSASYESSNPIDSLGGQPDALTGDMLFTGNNQANNLFIDKYEPSADGKTAFVESGYGKVAVQNIGPNGQRTFCFSYSLADLADGEMPNTRDELFNRILNFFDIYTDVPVLVEQASMNCKVYPNPVKTRATIQYNLPEDSQVSLEIFNSKGQKISQLLNGKQFEGVHSMQWNAEGMPAGIYYYSLRSGKQASTGKIVLFK
jgi:hypothetical protein